MGIPGLLPHLSGPSGPSRKSLTQLSAAHYTAHSRPLRLAIDTQIWLFQIQSGRGGTNPALRTFYYRLLRLLGLNIHPLFVFDGPHKPLMKRGKRVGQAGGAGGGGGGVRVVSVPEFLAKQLLKLFGFPWHIAPGEAEAECALLQREGLVDAVLSEDVDTLMFGCGVTFRNWSAATAPNNSCSGDGEAEGGAGGPRAGAAAAAAGGGNKPPTHIDVWRAEDTFTRSRGVDGEGMILVALLSGGDYLPDGVLGIGVKVAVDAARAGFGSSLCSLARSRDLLGLEAWKEKLEHEIKTNESGFFSRRNGGWTGFPDSFPDLEVLGYYTNPCVSSAAKVAQLRREVVWDQPIDFAALRTFAGEAFDWRCLGGAKKFVKNLAPALLVRELRLQASRTSCYQIAGKAECGREVEQGDEEEDDDLEAQAATEARFVKAIHGKRFHASTDGECEYRVSFLPHAVVPIDFSIEEEEEETYVPAGGGRACEPAEDDSDAESEVPASTQQEGDASPSKRKKRVPRPYDPDELEKLWVPKVFLQLGCPLLIEDWEASFSDPRKFLEARRKAKAGGQGAGAQKASGKGKGRGVKKGSGMEAGALTAFTKVTKVGIVRSREDGGAGNGKTDQRADRGALRDVCANSQSQCTVENGGGKGDKPAVSLVSTLPSSTAPAALFRMPSSQAQLGSAAASQYPAPKTLLPRREIEVLDLASHDICDDVSTTTQRPVSAPANSVARAHQQRAATSFPTLPSSQQPPPHEPKKPKKAKEATEKPATQKPLTPKRPPKRRSNELCSPASKPKSPFAAISLLSSSPAVRSPVRSQQTMITAFYPPTPSPVRVRLQSTQILPSRQRAEIHGKEREERKEREVVDLISSSPPRPSSGANSGSLSSARAGQLTRLAPVASRGKFVARCQTPTPPNTRFKFVREDVQVQPGAGGGAGEAAGATATGKGSWLSSETREIELTRTVASHTPSSSRPSLEEMFSPGKLPDTVTKRRKKGGALKRWATEGDVLSFSSPLLWAEKGDEDLDVDLDLDLGFGRDRIDEVRSHVWGEDFVGEDPAFGSPTIAISGGGFLLEHVNGREVERDFGRNECEADARDIDLLDADFREDHGAFCPGDLIAATEPRDDEYDTEALSSLHANRDRNTNRFLPTASIMTQQDTIPKTSVSHSQSQQLIAARAAASPTPVLASTNSCAKPQTTSTPASEQSLAQPQLRRSSRQQFAQKRRIHLRQSLEGYWREVEVRQSLEGAEALDLSGDGSGWRVSRERAQICGEGLSSQGDGMKLRGAKGGASGWRRSGVEVLDLTGA